VNERALLKQAFRDGAPGEHEYARAMADFHAALAVSDAARLVRFERMEEDTVETNFVFLHREAHASLASELSG
jgi:hypothetical protein